MGKKVKVGKQRRDKAYWSAKEIGYRSRASFKLIQLNRKFEFLQKSRVCIDLCAAPGSWMQVAKEHMPMSSLIIGVDLAPIKPLAGCITMQNDITTEKCRVDLKKELQGWNADLILHDGAPNVGKSWVHDAYNQSLLTLSAFKLASEFLQKGGTFVTKVFRSKDYSSLLWVLNQFFKRVNATKPVASRNESAEIFVVCMGYKAPDKIDPKFFSPKHVFGELEPETSQDKELLNPEKKKRAPAEGYESGKTLLFSQAKASDFILGDSPIHVLNNCHEIVLDQPRIQKHKKTTQEIVECCKDIKVLGMKELRLLKKWREALREQFLKQDADTQGPDAVDDEKGVPAAEGEGEVDADADEDDEELQKLDDEIAVLRDEERRAAKRLRKKALKEKQKRSERINLKMIIPGDQGPVHEEEGLFSVKGVRSKKHLADLTKQAASPEAFASEQPDPKTSKKKKKLEHYDKESGCLDKSGLFYKESGSEDEGSGMEDDDDSSMEDLGLSIENGAHDNDEEMPDLDAPEPENPLLVDFEDAVSRKERRAEMWFDRDIFKSIENSEDGLEEEDVTQAIEDIKKKGGKMMSRPEPRLNGHQAHVDGDDDDDDDDSDSSGDDDQDAAQLGTKAKPSLSSGGGGGAANGFEIVPAVSVKKKRQPVLSAEELALGQELIVSKKRRRELMDAAWNRYMFEDKDSDLPDWFVQEEQYHMRRRPQVQPEVVQEYKERFRDVNTKTIKKVVEAKARKKRRLAKKMDKARKKAASILDNNDLGSREKASEIKKLYKKAAAAVSGKKKDVQYVVAKKATAAKRAKRPAGVKGFYKQVDPRMKKDNHQQKRQGQKGPSKKGQKGPSAKSRRTASKGKKPR